MNVARKRFLFAAWVLLIAAIGGVSWMIVALGRHQFIDPGIAAHPGPLEPVNDSKSPKSLAEIARFGPGTDDWKTPGRQWRLRVKKYPQPPYASTPVMDYYLGLAKQKSTPPDEFLMLVRVLPIRHIDDRDVARFQFIPTNSVPKYYLDSVKGANFVLEVDVQMGQALEFHPERATRWSVRSFDDEKYLQTQLWFPVDWMLRSVDLATVPARKKYTKPTRDERGEPKAFIKSLEAVNVPTRLPNASKKTEQAVRIEWSHQYTDKYRLVQIWVPGEPWWRSFQRYYGDRLDLEATWVGEN